MASRRVSRAGCGLLAKSVFAAPFVARVVDVSVGWHSQRDAFRILLHETALTAPAAAEGGEIRVLRNDDTCALLVATLVAALACPVISGARDVAVHGHANLDARAVTFAIAA